MAEKQGEYSALSVLCILIGQCLRISNRVDGRIERLWRKIHGAKLKVAAFLYITFLISIILIWFVFLNYLLSLVPALVQTSRNNIVIKFPSKGFNPYISVAYDVSSLKPSINSIWILLMMRLTCIIKHYCILWLIVQLSWRWIGGKVFKFLDSSEEVMFTARENSGRVLWSKR